MSAKKTAKVVNVDDQLDAELSARKITGLVDFAENMEDMSVVCVGTGFAKLDRILHPTLKGMPLGRDVEIYSKKASAGKTSLALQILASYQKKGMRTAIIDIERTITPQFMKQFGIVMIPNENPDIYATRVVRPPEGLTAEDVLNTVRDLSQFFDLIVIDSVAAMAKKDDMEKTADQRDQIGALALAMSNFIKKNLAKRATVIWLNQTRMKIGGYNPSGQPQFTTCGGTALPFYATLRIELTALERIKDPKTEEVMAYRVKVFTEKNKIAPQWKTIHLTYVLGEGFSILYDYFDMGRKLGLIQKSGGWFNFGELKVQGEVNFYNHLKEDADLFNTLKEAVDEEESA